MIISNNNLKYFKKNIYYFYKELGHYENEHKFYKNKQLRLYNWYCIDPEFWLIKFIYERGLLDFFNNKTISVYSVFGHRFNIGRDSSDFKIFYTGENVHAQEFSFSGKYDDYLLNNEKVNLSIGFDYIEHSKYIRFPLWITYLFKANSTFDDIKRVCDTINNTINVQYRSKFCAFLSRIDRFGYREDFYQQISKINSIDCDGLFRHNNDDLKNKFNDNKLEYLKQYRFNLCPENSNYPGYCTEKIFESLQSGCIPIYWGSDNNPEPHILNHEAILFVEPFKTNEFVLERLQEIEASRSAYYDFLKINRFQTDAAQKIYSYFIDLEEKIKGLLNNALE